MPAGLGKENPGVKKGEIQETRNLFCKNHCINDFNGMITSYKFYLEIQGCLSFYISYINPQPKSNAGK